VVVLVERVRMSNGTIFRTLVRKYHTICGPVQFARVRKNNFFTSGQEMKLLKSGAKVAGQCRGVVEYGCHGGGIDRMTNFTFDTAPGIASLSGTDGGLAATVFDHHCVTDINKRKGLWEGNMCGKRIPIVETTHQDHSNYLLTLNKNENQVERIAENKKQNSTESDLGHCLFIVRFATIVLFAICTGVSAKGHIQSLRAVFTGEERRAKKNIIYFIPENIIKLSNDAEKEFIQVELNCVDG